MSGPTREVVVAAERELSLLEAVLGLPGIQSPVGARLRQRARADLESYFWRLRRALEALGLEQLVGVAAEGPRELTSAQVAFIQTQVDTLLAPAVEEFGPLLAQTLAFHLATAYETGATESEERLTRDAATRESFTEQVDEPTGAFGGRASDFARAAERYARERTATLVRGVNEETRRRLRGLITRGVRDGLGGPELGRLIRRDLVDMGRRRATLIANTELNDAFSQSSLDRMTARGAAGKTTVLSVNPCPICIANHGQGALPLEQGFQSGHVRTPFHPDCQCTLVAARLST